MKKDIQQKETDGKGMFYIEKDGDIIAELTYTLQDNNIMTLDHTETNPEHSGEGLASDLVKHSVDYAREKDLKIDPLCKYAAKQFERHEEYQEVQATEE
ncbi:GNAT family N-acetyltransferase [Salinimicrobium sp. TH3]|uniref:GNAT family N-acetyltransferase n=1 Tax=Salinimicrobium sp. TH3 TaxID=2997342 RepID=UPI002276E26F|nr:GNAT family N-acetyltransferase [Salinimicrobium sp. TH3]MCY2688422.1 GNAT family N-acetyltransferase [Salinimicrobium sp. TH3]